MVHKCHVIYIGLCLLSDMPVRYDKLNWIRSLRCDKLNSVISGWLLRLDTPSVPEQTTFGGRVVMAGIIGRWRLVKLYFDVCMVTL